MSWLRFRSRRRDRGVSAPEYALIAAVLITALAAVLQGLTDKAGDKLQTTGDQVATGAPAPTTSSTSTPPVSSTSTTLAPTTSTTAAPTTSTTAAPTTTTAAATGSVGVPTWGAVSGANGTWTANGQYQVTSNGQPVSGAGITVRSRECTWFFIWVCGNWTTSGPYTTGSDGKANVSLSAGSTILYLEVQVTGVSMPPGKTWDGAANNSTVATPYV